MNNFKFDKKSLGVYIYIYRLKLKGMVGKEIENKELLY